MLSPETNNRLNEKKKKNIYIYVELTSPKSFVHTHLGHFLSRDWVNFLTDLLTTLTLPRRRNRTREKSTHPGIQSYFGNMGRPEFKVGVRYRVGGGIFSTQEARVVTSLDHARFTALCNGSIIRGASLEGEQEDRNEI